MILSLELLQKLTNEQSQPSSEVVDGKLAKRQEEEKKPLSEAKTVQTTVVQNTPLRENYFMAGKPDTSAFFRTNTTAEILKTIPDELSKVMSRIDNALKGKEQSAALKETIRILLEINNLTSLMKSNRYAMPDEDKTKLKSDLKRIFSKDFKEQLLVSIKVEAIKKICCEVLDSLFQITGLNEIPKESPSP